MTTPIGSLPALSAAKPAEGNTTPADPRLREAARQFEAVFLRVMLTSLERTTKIGGATPFAAGQSAYGSMVVDALSDALSASGGIGLQHSLLQGLGAQAPKSSDVNNLTRSSQGSETPAVQLVETKPGSSGTPGVPRSSP
jgi:Rod binding domain-containing protein